MTYQKLPFVVDMDEARKPDAPRVFEPDGAPSVAAGVSGAANVFAPTRNSFLGGSRGDIAKGFTEADIIVEGEFRTQVQTHCCLEPHAVAADWQPDGLTVYISTQILSACVTILPQPSAWRVNGFG